MFFWRDKDNLLSYESAAEQTGVVPLRNTCSSTPL